MQQSPASSSASACAGAARTRAPAPGSWIEHGPTTTSSRSSSPRRMRTTSSRRAADRDRGRARGAAAPRAGSPAGAAAGCSRCAGPGCVQTCRAMYTRRADSSTATPCYPSTRGEPSGAPGPDPEEGVVARHLHGSPRQCAPSERGRFEGRRPPGVVVLDRQPADRALFRRAPSRRSRRREGSRVAGVLRDPVPARPADVRGLRELRSSAGSRLTRAVARCRRRRPLDRLDGPRRRAGDVWSAGVALRRRSFRR